MIKIVIFSGSARKNNYTQHVASFVAAVAGKNPELEVTVVSPTSLGLTFENEGTEADYPELRELVEGADGFIAVCPEYNHGYSGSLKYMLDLNLKEYIHKPIAFVGVSSGQIGGARGVEALVPIVREMGLIATFTDVLVSNVNEEVVDGVFTDQPRWEKRVNRLLAELIWMATTLQLGRSRE